MPRKTFEFNCPTSGGGCGKYFDVRLNTSINGYYRIHCPNCGHIHYRDVKNGQITDTRFTQDKNRDDSLIEDIYPMKSCCRDFQKESYFDVVESTQGFMHRLWAEKFSG